MFHGSSVMTPGIETKALVSKSPKNILLINKHLKCIDEMYRIPEILFIYPGLQERNCLWERSNYVALWAWITWLDVSSDRIHLLKISDLLILRLVLSHIGLHFSFSRFTWKKRKPLGEGCQIWKIQAQGALKQLIFKNDKLVLKFAWGVCIQVSVCCLSEIPGYWVSWLEYHPKFHLLGACPHVAVGSGGDVKRQPNALAGCVTLKGLNQALMGNQWVLQKGLL